MTVKLISPSEGLEYPQETERKKRKDQDVSSEIKSETFICFVLVGHNLEERLTHRR